MEYFRAINTGTGFITHEDQLDMTIEMVLPDIYKVTGNYQSWVERTAATKVLDSEVDISLNNIKIKREISIIEAGQSRAIREAIVANNTQYILDIDNKINALRAQLQE
jgi:hypothetical protein